MRKKGGREKNKMNLNIEVLVHTTYTEYVRV